MESLLAGDVDVSSDVKPDLQPAPIRDEAQRERSRKDMKYSTKACNPEGLQEKELSAREQWEKPAGNRYKPRHRSQLLSAEIDDIVLAYDVGHKK